MSYEMVVPNGDAEVGAGPDYVGVNVNTGGKSVSTIAITQLA